VEAINNAVKYSNASALNIKFKSDATLFSVSILDDGIGFDMESTRLGNGLINIRKRAEDIKSDVSIVSYPGGGCTILLSLRVM